MNRRYDFHIHSCLSPCGDDDMTPVNICNMAKLSGLGIIALTDHNSCLNCPAAVKAGLAAGITVIPGMELCTCEEVHLICLFPSLEKALSFSGFVRSSMPDIKNRPAIFGNQIIMNEEDEPAGTEERLLTLASSVGCSEAVETVKSYGGICYPAHIDRSSYSVLSNLGTISSDMGFSAFEISDSGDLSTLKEKHPVLNGMLCMRGSDAHYLENMSMDGYSFEEVYFFLKSSGFDV